MDKLKVNVDGKWQDLEKVETVEINGEHFEIYKDFVTSYNKEPARICGEINTECDIQELFMPKCFVANDEIEKEHLTYMDIVSDTTFALIYDACLEVLYRIKAIHCVSENDRIYYEWDYETLETGVPLPHDDRPCYEKGRVVVKYKIIRFENKDEIYDRNFKRMTKGEFGNPEKFETMVAYWEAQAEAGYPYASENVKYFQEMVAREKFNNENTM